MKKPLLIIIFIILYTISVSGQVKTKVQGYVQRGGNTVSTQGLTSSTKVQQSYPSCTIRVFDKGTSNLSTIYSDSSGTSKSNPFTSSSDGSWFFYAPANTHYDIQFSGTGFSTFTNGDITSPPSGGISTLINIKVDYNAKGDGVIGTTGAINSSSSTLTCNTCNFTSTVVDSGKLIDIEGAGASGKNLVTTISTITNSTTAILSTIASTTVTGRHVVYGTNDRTVIQNALNAGQNIYIPKGNYIIGSPGLSISQSSMSIWGDGLFSSILISIGPVNNSSGTFYNTITIGADKQTFHDIGVTGTNWNAEQILLGDAPDGIRATNRSDIIVYNCRFDNTWGIGLHSEFGGSNWRITNCQGNYNAATGFNPNITGGGLIFTNNIGIGNATGMIEAAASGMVVSNNFATLNRGVGFSIGGSTCDGEACVVRINSITGNVIYKNGTFGIVVAENNEITIIASNTIRQNDVGGIYLSNGTPVIPGTIRNSITGNIISSNGCTSASSCTSGSVSGTAGVGILIGDGNNLIQDNYILNESITNFTQFYGIEIASGIDNVKILRNYVTGSQNADYLFDGATNVLFYNEVTTATISSSGTSFLYVSPTVNNLTINQKETLVPTVIADTSLNPFNPANLRLVYITLAGNRTIDPFNGTDGQLLTLIVVQDATGNRTLTYSGGFRGATNIGAGQVAGKTNTQTFIFRTGLGWIAYTGAIQNQ